MRDQPARLDAAPDGRLLLESIPDWVWVAGPDGSARFLAAQALEALGLTADEVRGEGWLRVLHPDDRERTIRAWTSSLATGAPYRIEYRVRLADGRHRWYLAQALAQREPKGEIARWVGTWTDVDDLKHAELDAARKALLLASVRDAVIVTSPEGVVTYWNEGATRLFGWSAEEMIGHPLMEKVPAEQRAHVATFRALVNGSSEGSSECLHWRKDGPPIWIESRVSGIVEAGMPRGMLGVSRDVTARKSDEAQRERLLEEAERSRLALEDLSRRLLASAEAERRRIAHELHDELGQILTVVHLSLQRLHQEVPGCDGARVATCLADVSQALAQIRDISIDLRPPSLDALGLAAAVETACRRLQDGGGVEVHLSSSIEGLRFSFDVETAGYRIVQEALTNVARHSGARHAWITLDLRDGRLELSVSDDGRGFDPSDRRGPTVGLLSMRERAQLTGGDVQVESAPGRGTTVRASLPAESPSP